jgi:hypothetical protein
MMNAKCKSADLRNTFTFSVHHFAFSILFLFESSSSKSVWFQHFDRHCLTETDNLIAGHNDLKRFLGFCQFRFFNLVRPWL